MHSDWTDLLVNFNARGVKYMVVGGHAFMHYAEPRYTKDLDVWVEASAENGPRVVAALREFGAPLDGMEEAFTRAEGFYQLGRPPLRIDVLLEIDGVRFGEAWERRQQGTLGGVPVSFLGLEDLIRNKRASGRARDLADLESLES